MTLIDPNGCYKTLNIFRMILYELKMGLNGLKCLSLNELKRASISIRFLLVMDISVRYDIYYDF